MITEYPKDVQYQGWFLKQGKKGLKPWRHRWAVIRGDTLSYYNSDSDTEPLGNINMLLCTVKTTEMGGSFFDVVTPTRTYHFQAKNKAEMMSWINHIRIASERMYNQLPSSTPQEPSFADPLSSSGATSLTRTQLVSSSTLTVKESDQNLQKLKSLLSTSGNHICADCSASGILHSLFPLSFVLLILPPLLSSLLFAFPFPFPFLVSTSI